MLSNHFSLDDYVIGYKERPRMRYFRRKSPQYVHTGNDTMLCGLDIIKNDNKMSILLTQPDCSHDSVTNYFTYFADAVYFASCMSGWLYEHTDISWYTVAFFNQDTHGPSKAMVSWEEGFFKEPQFTPCSIEELPFDISEYKDILN